MRGFRLNITVAIAAACSFWLTPRAGADTITAKLTGVKYALPYTTINLVYNGNTMSNAIAGPEMWQQTSGAADVVTDGSGNFITYCIEIMQDVLLSSPASSYTFTIQPNLALAPIPGTPMGPTEATEIKKLWALHYGDANSATKAAAFQLAIWDILYDSDLTVNNNTGNFKATGDSASGAVITQAQTWLNDVANGSLTYQTPDLVALTNSSNQDQITLTPPPVPPPQSAPLPSTAWAGASLLLALGARTVHKRRQPVAGT